MSYVRTRGWNDDEIAGAVERLRAAGLVDGDEFTEAGERLRADIEWCTDQQERPIVAALGADAEELLGAARRRWPTPSCRRAATRPIPA